MCSGGISMAARHFLNLTTFSGVQSLPCHVPVHIWLVVWKLFIVHILGTIIPFDSYFSGGYFTTNQLKYVKIRFVDAQPARSSCGFTTTSVS
jgi:hypothetical protein